MVVALFRGDFVYDFVLWLHILTAIVGFGSTFVWPFLAAKAQGLGEPKVGYYVSQMAHEGGRILTEPFIYGVGVTGLLLAVFAAGADPAVYEFSDLWITLTFIFYLGALGLSLGLHQPNLRAMLKLQEELVSMGPPPQSAGAAAAGGPPPQVLELQERGKKAAMYGGLLHLSFVVVLVLMVFKPGA